MIKLIDFYADWCAPCKIMSPIIDEIEKKMGDKIQIEKIDVDSQVDLASKYNVMSIPTYVVEKDGQEVDRFIGARAKDQVLQILQKHL